MKTIKFITINLFHIIDYYLNTTRESIDLTISQQFPLEDCSQLYLTLVDFISFYSSKITNATSTQEQINVLTLINLCIDIDLKSVQNFKNLRRISFHNCTIRFLSSQQREDYDFYPKNLTQWLFNQGRTDSFDQFIRIINQIGIH